VEPNGVVCRDGSTGVRVDTITPDLDRIRRVVPAPTDEKRERSGVVVEVDRDNSPAGDKLGDGRGDLEKIVAPLGSYLERTDPRLIGTVGLKRAPDPHGGYSGSAASAPRANRASMSA